MEIAEHSFSFFETYSTDHSFVPPLTIIFNIAQPILFSYLWTECAVFLSFFAVLVYGSAQDLDETQRKYQTEHGLHYTHQRCHLLQLKSSNGSASSGVGQFKSPLKCPTSLRMAWLNWPLIRGLSISLQPGISHKHTQGAACQECTSLKSATKKCINQTIKLLAIAFRTLRTFLNIAIIVMIL